MRTPFDEIHRTRGAQWTEYQGWELPDQFTDAVEEYNAVRNSVGVIDVSYRATFRLTGPERADFLHRILSNDIKSLWPGSGRHAALLTAQGKLIGVMKVLATDDTILLETEPAARPALFDKLEMYKLAQKVHLEDVTDSVAKLLVQGPKATALLRAIINQELALDEELQHREYQIGAVPIRLIRTDETGEVGYELMAPAAQASPVWTNLFHAGAAFDLTPVGLRAFNLLRVEAGVPWYGVDMDDTNFPQEAGVDYVLDWNKGCYVGQEPVARIKFRGHVNKRLVSLRFAGEHPPQSGDKIVKDGREIGRITSAIYSPRLNCPIALGYVRREFLEPGTEVGVEMVGGPAAAIVE
jgi:glycine cleavage system T protein